MMKIVGDSLMQSQLVKTNLAGSSPPRKIIAHLSEVCSVTLHDHSDRRIGWENACRARTKIYGKL